MWDFVSLQRIQLAISAFFFVEPERKKSEKNYISLYWGVNFSDVVSLKEVENKD